MKQNYLFLLAILAFAGVKAQVLNPGFEDWATKQNQINFSGTFQGVPYSVSDPQFTFNDLVDWSSLNQLTPTASVEDLATGSLTYEQVAEETTDFVEGATSVFIESREIEISVATQFGTIPFANTAPGLIISGEFILDVGQFADELVNGAGLNSLNPFIINGTGQAIDFSPKTLYGSYKYTSANGDSALVLSGVIKNREMVAYTIKRLPSANTWTDFSLNFNYLNCETPDTIVTLICSSNLDANFDAMGNFSVDSDYTGEIGSQLYIDDLTMDTFDVNNFPPIAEDDNTTIFQGQVATRDVLLNDEFCGGTPNSPVVYVDGANGTTTVNANDELEYTPNTGFNGIDEVEYYVCNSLALCDTATWFINVTQVVSCVANDDTRSLNQDEAVVFDATANDDDCGTIPTIVSIPLNGTADVETNGNISYSPVSGFVGTDSLTYAICSAIDSAQCDTAKIVYTVLEVVGIKEIPASIISIAPNPAKDRVTVKIDGNYNIVKISVFNLLGNQLFSSTFNNQIELNTKNYATGVYLIQLENELGRAVKKLVIAK